MAKLILGGIKSLAGRCEIRACCRGEESAHASLCRDVAASKINLSCFIYTTDPAERYRVMTVHTEAKDADGVHVHVSRSCGQECHIEEQYRCEMLSVFPFNQKPGVAGRLLQALVGTGLAPSTFATSPSAISVAIRTQDRGRAISALFNTFQFPSYRSPLDWHAAYAGCEQLLREIVCSYEEEIIKVYGIIEQTDLDLWKCSVPVTRLQDLGTALLIMDEEGIRMPFLIVQTDWDDRRLIACCLARSHRRHVTDLLTRHGLGSDYLAATPVAVLYLHGPHFGDRYGIARALTATMSKANIAPLAISCSVSSMSAVVQEHDLESTSRALHQNFEVAR